MKLKILFVDDDENILAGFRAMLHSKRKEWACRFASSAEAALEMVRAEPFDVVLSDMRMPSMDGADFLKAVEGIQPDTVRIILSGYSESAALFKAVKNAHQFISKPCSSECIIEAIHRVTDLRTVLTDAAVRPLVSGVDALPATPELFFKITRELESPEPDLKKVAKLVQQDVGVSATLMKLVNSSFFGFYEKVSSPLHAVTLLGVEALKGLVLGVQLFNELKSEEMEGYSVEKLWSHSLETGYLAKHIASIEGVDKEAVNTCFTVGLLHDIGKLVLITKMPDRYKPVLESVRKQGGPLIELERDALGVTHAEIGAYLLGLWGFRKDIVQAVHSHHSMALCSTDFFPVTALHVANVFQHEMAPRKSDYVFSKPDTRIVEQLDSHGRMDRWREECMNLMEERYVRT